MKKVLSLTAGLVFSVCVWAQNDGKVLGKVVENEETPVPFANVALYNLSDSSLVTGAVSSDNGDFEINAKEGKYYIVVKFVSYENKYISPIEIRADQIVRLGNILMSAMTETLDEVMISAERAQMQLELDKRVFNIGETLSNSGANATEVLENLPGITVDVDGNVALRGSQSVRILINGKPSGLVGLSGSDALRQLQGDVIERVEVITNPSARYDAEGTAGIINIVLKKDSRKGFNGAFTLNSGFPANYGASGTINYRKNKLNLFGNYGIGYRERPGFADSYQRFTYPDTTYSTLRNRDFNRTGLNNTFRFGLDYDFNDKNTLSGSMLVRIGDDENITDVSYEDFNSLGTLIGRSLRRDIEKETDNTYEFQMNYKHLFEGAGHEFTATAQYRLSAEIEDSRINQNANEVNDEPALYQSSYNGQDETELFLQADYVNPISKNKKLEAGYRGTMRGIFSDFLVEERNELGEWITLDNFSNQFDYDETVHALYGIFENKNEKWGYQLGLRAENTYIRTYQRETNEENEQRYLNLFPSTFLTFNIDKLNTLQASYSRRISRPRFWYLNPFFSYSDPRNLRTGNIFLMPEFTDSYEVGYLGNREKFTFYTGLYYRFTSGVIERLDFVNEEGITISRPVNLSSRDAYGFEGNLTYDPTDWLNLSANANFFRSITSGTVEGQTFGADTYIANLRSAAKIDIGAYAIQFTGNYQSPQQTAQGSSQALYTLDMGLNRDLLKGNGTLVLAVRDVFNSRKYRSVTQGEFFYSESSFQWMSRVATLSFTYRINQKKKEGGDRRGGEDFGGDMDF